MSFSQSFIEKVRESNNIVDLIGQYTQLKRNGGRFFGLCPFPDHNEKTPSFSVTDDKQLYHCFGCKKGGNIFTFLQTYQGLSFPESVEYLADRAGIEIEREEQPKQSAEQFAKAKDERKLYFKMNKLAADYYSFVLSKRPQDHPHNEYLVKRRMTAEVIEKFQIGISPEKWQGLVDVFDKRKAPLEAAEKLGLVKKKKQGDGYFDLFRDRLMFPIHSPSGEVLAFGGRTFGDDQPKYLNSPETPVFHKGKTFYGLHETAKYIRTEDEVIVVEGYMDLIALYSAGIRNVVAVLGTALTDHHAKILKRYTKNVLVLFDGDSAGQRAAERSLPILLAHGLLPREVRLDDGKDPDDFLNEFGVDQLREVLKAAPEFFNSFLTRTFKEFGTGSSNTIRIVDKVGPVLASVEDPRLKYLYVKETVDLLGVEEGWLKASLKRVDRHVPESGDEPSPSSRNLRGDASQIQSWRMKDLAKAELQLLQVGLQERKNLDFLLEKLTIEETSKTGREIFSWLEGEYRQDPEGFDRLPALLASKVDMPNFVTMTLNSTPLDASENTSSKLIEDCVKWIHGRYLKAKAKELASELKGQPSAKQLEQFMNVQKRKHSLRRGEGPETETES